MGSLDGSYFQLLKLLSYTIHSSLLTLCLFLFHAVMYFNVCDIGLFDLENGNYALPQSTWTTHHQINKQSWNHIKMVCCIVSNFPYQTFQWHKNIFFTRILELYGAKYFRKKKFRRPDHDQ